jgi:PST family polysaccharide transporter
LAILNGKSSINSYTIINTLGSLFALVLTVVLVYYYKVIGALYALALSQTLVFFISVTLLIKTEWFSYKFFNKKFNKKIARKLGNYSFMAVITALTIPVSQIIVRNYLIEKVGVNSGGYWQAMTRISDGYLMIVTTSLSTYYLPKLSKLKSNKDIKAEIFKVYKLILPFVLASCIIIYYLRFYIINLLFSASFIEIESLFLFQLIGDFFKISAWIIAYLMIAKAMTKTFIVTEIIFSLSYLALNYFLINNFGLIGSIYAFTINYFVYLIVMIELFKNKFLNVNE